MKILVVSDSHDHLGAVREAVALAGQHGARAIIHCGDLCSPIPLFELAEFSGPVHVTFGNNDAEQYAMRELREENWPNVSFHKPFGDVVFDGARIPFEHYPDTARGLAATGDYQAVFCGHTHVEKQEQVGDCLLLNVGELMGWKGTRTAYLYDTSTGTPTRLVIDAHW